MRLIDADELRAGTCAECALKGEKCLGDDCDWDSVWHIDHAPTVPAIPLAWLDAQIHGYASALKSTELKALLLVKAMWEEATQDALLEALKARIEKARDA